jgi:hypothetical protein
MKFLSRIWAEILKGENIELYITIAAAVILVILNLLQIVPNEWLVPLELAILALIAVSLLRNRHQIDRLMDQAAARNPVVLTQFPDSLLLHEIDKARQLTLIGVDLGQVLKKNYPRLEEKLRKGHRIRIMLVDPGSPACEMAAIFHYEPTTCEDKKILINHSIRILQELKQKTKGRLEIRLLDHLPTFGAFITDVNTADGAIFIWHYAFKAGDTDRLKLMLKHSDGPLYEKFKVEINAIWEHAVPLPPKEGKETPATLPGAKKAGLHPVRGAIRR